MAYIGCYHDHHDSDHEIIFHGVEGERRFTAPYLGIELEVDGGDEYCSRGSIVDNIEAQFRPFVNNDDEFIYFEDDGSLSTGFEIITNPATLSFHLKNREVWEGVFRYLMENDYRGYNTTTCGLHVHVDKQFFGATEERKSRSIENVLTIVDNHWDNIQIFSRRSHNDIARWADKIHKEPKEVVRDMTERRYNLSRYQCVNLVNDNTIEFRVFKSTLNPNSFFASLELVNNICTFAKTKTISQVNEMRWEDLLCSDNLKEYWERVKNRRVA